MKTPLPFFILYFFCGCGGATWEPLGELSDAQPQIVSISPSDGSTDVGNMIAIQFTQPIDMKSLSSKSLALLPVAEGALDSIDLWQKVKKGDLKGVTGDYKLDESQQTLSFVPTDALSSHQRYAVLATPEIFSVNRLPLTINPSVSAAPFLSTFYTPGTAADITATPSAGGVERPSFLKLNEIFYDAVGEDTSGVLFLELFGEEEKNISGYQILFVRGSDGEIYDSIKFPAGMNTNASGLFVVADAITNQPGMTHVDGADWVTNFDPLNGPDCIQLLDDKGSLLDAIGYGSPLVLRGKNNQLCYEGHAATDVPSGSSLARAEAGIDSNDNAVDWIPNPSPTPGF